jgi:hypothetical protein
MNAVDVVPMVKQVVRSHRWRLEDEKRLQADLHSHLAAAGVELRREVRLDPKSRIDFMAGAIGIEVKIKGSKRDIYRQVERYCQFEAIAELVLISNVPLGLPAFISGKRIHIIDLTSALA